MPAGGLFSTAGDVLKFAQTILNGNASNSKRYISLASLREMTSRQNEQLSKAGYGFGWSVSSGGYGHGAFKNDMEINSDKGRVLIFMVQQDGPWGTTEGDAIISRLSQLSDEMGASNAKAYAAGAASTVH